MEQTRKKRNSTLSVILFLLLLGAVFIAVVSYLFTPSDGIINTSFSNKKVAIVRLEGVIIDSAKIIDQLKKWAQDDSVKAIVIRITSPGGLVTPSQEIYNEVQRAGKQKPVIASMGYVAASGGYYIAAACNAIFANPGTITGSIGVIMMFSNTEKLMDWIGLETIVIKSGKFKDTGASHRPFTEADKALMQGVVDDTFDQFITDAALGRKMDIETMRKLADGRIYTGRQAKENNLVDKLGDLKDAIDFAAKAGGIEGKPDIVEEIEEPGLLRRLFGEDFVDSILNRFAMPTGLYFLWPAW